MEQTILQQLDAQIKDLESKIQAAETTYMQEITALRTRMKTETHSRRKDVVMLKKLRAEYEKIAVGAKVVEPKSEG